MAPDKKFIPNLLQFVYEQSKGSMAGELLQGRSKELGPQRGLVDPRRAQFDATRQALKLRIRLACDSQHKTSGTIRERVDPARKPLRLVSPLRLTQKA